MNLIDKIKFVIITKMYIGKTKISSLKGKLTKKLISGWKNKSVAEKTLKVCEFDMEQIKKGNANYNIKTNIAFIKATGLKKLSLLDVGCGTGRYAKIFEMLLPSYEIDYTGIDYSKEHIKIAKKTYKVGNAKFRVANQESLPFKNKSFDVATSFSVLPYAPHYEKAIAELRRVARKYVLITSISVTKGEEQILKQQAYGAEWSCTLFSEKKLKEVIKKNKLKIIKDVTLKDGGERIEKSYMLKVMK